MNKICLVRFDWSVGWLAAWFVWSIYFFGRPSGSWGIYCGRTAGAMLLVNSCITFSDVKYQNACFCLSSEKI